MSRTATSPSNRRRRSNPRVASLPAAMLCAIALLCAQHLHPQVPTQSWPGEASPPNTRAGNPSHPGKIASLPAPLILCSSHFVSRRCPASRMRASPASLSSWQARPPPGLLTPDPPRSVHASLPHCGVGGVPHCLCLTVYGDTGTFTSSGSFGALLQWKPQKTLLGAASMGGLSGGSEMTPPPASTPAKVRAQPFPTIPVVNAYSVPGPVVVTAVPKEVSPEGVMVTQGMAMASDV